jgi:hypothetical protein
VPPAADAEDVYRAFPDDGPPNERHYTDIIAVICVMNVHQQVPVPAMNALTSCCSPSRLGVFCVLQGVPGERRPVGGICNSYHDERNSPHIHCKNVHCVMGAVEDAMWNVTREIMDARRKVIKQRWRVYGSA